MNHYLIKLLEIMSLYDDLVIGKDNNDSERDGNYFIIIYLIIKL